MAQEQGSNHLQLFDTRQDMPTDLFDDESIAKLLDVGFSKTSAGFLRDVGENPSRFKSYLREHRGRIEHDTGIVDVFAAYLSANYIRDHISGMYHQMAQDAFTQNSAPLFVFMFDLSLGILQPVGAVLLGENQIHNRNDATIDQNIKAAYEFYGERFHRPFTTADYAEDYAIVGQQALEAADMLAVDPTGFSIVDHIVSALETGEENIFLNQLGQHVRPFILAGARLAQSLHRK